MSPIYRNVTERHSIVRYDLRGSLASEHHKQRIIANIIIWNVRNWALRLESRQVHGIDPRISMVHDCGLTPRGLIVQMS
jgi:hypothetical protein